MTVKGYFPTGTNKKLFWCTAPACFIIKADSSESVDSSLSSTAASKDVALLILCFYIHFGRGLVIAGFTAAICWTAGSVWCVLASTIIAIMSACVRSLVYLCEVESVHCEHYTFLTMTTFYNFDTST